MNDRILINGFNSMQQVRSILNADQVAIFDLSFWIFTANPPSPEQTQQLADSGWIFGDNRYTYRGSVVGQIEDAE